MTEQQRKQKNRSLKHKYNMTIDQYEEMFEKQGRVCACCKRDKPENTHWEIDHDHTCCQSPHSGVGKTCGKCMRGIVCAWCNKMLAWSKDDPYRLSCGVSYLLGSG